VAGALLGRQRDGACFFWFAAAIVLALVSLAAGLYLDLLISTTSARYSMTVSNASSAAETLGVMQVVAVIGLPLVLLYTAGVQYPVPGKVTLTGQLTAWAGHPFCPVTGPTYEGRSPLNRSRDDGLQSDAWSRAMGAGRRRPRAGDRRST
jgi:hypothetical protein